MYVIKESKNLRYSTSLRGKLLQQFDYFNFDYYAVQLEKKSTSHIWPIKPVALKAMIVTIRN